MSKLPFVQDCTPIFSSGGGIKLAEKCKIPFLGSIPIDPAFAQLMDASMPVDPDNECTDSTPLLQQYGDSTMAIEFSSIRDKILESLGNVLKDPVTQ
jgi:hypothetical protein